MGKLRQNRKKPDLFSVSHSHKKRDEKGHKKAKVVKSDTSKGTVVSTSLRRIQPCEDLLVWARCKGFGWWPGRIANRSELKGPIDPPDDPTRWVNWFGDNKYTETRVDQMQYFHDFTRFFKENVYNRSQLYRQAVDFAITVACSRAGRLNKDSKSALSWARNGFYPEGYMKILPTDMSDAELYTDCDSSSQPQEKAVSYYRKKTDKTGTLNTDQSMASDFTEQLKYSFDQVRKSTVDIDTVCMGCGSLEVQTPHPLFVGGLCEHCQIDYIESFYLVDDAGYYLYCCVCGGGKEVITCDNESCYRSMCRTCIDCIVGKNTFNKEAEKSHWICYLCVSKRKHGCLIRRDGWPDNLQRFMNEDKSTKDSEILSLPLTIPLTSRGPIRVLSLFDGIATGCLALKELKLKLDCYCASEIDHEARCVSEVRHAGLILNIGDVCDVDDAMLQKYGPFDLVIGGSPCNDLSIVNPSRKGLWSGSGQLFFEYVRILRSCQLIAATQGKFVFWLFENVVCMDKQSKTDISRFLQRNPVCLDAKVVSPAHRPRYYWGNLPGMNRPMVASASHKLTLQDCLEPGRKAMTEKLRTITTKSASVRKSGSSESGENATSFIVSSIPLVLQRHNQKDTLWITEIERNGENKALWFNSRCVRLSNAFQGRHSFNSIQRHRVDGTVFGQQRKTSHC